MEFVGLDNIQHDTEGPAVSGVHLILHQVLQSGLPTAGALGQLLILCIVNRICCLKRSWGWGWGWGWRPLCPTCVERCSDPPRLSFGSIGKQHHRMKATKATLVPTSRMKSSIDWKHSIQKCDSLLSLRSHRLLAQQEVVNNEEEILPGCHNHLDTGQTDWAFTMTGAEWGALSGLFTSSEWLLYVLLCLHLR